MIKEMPLRPAPGEIMLYVDLRRVENMTPIEVLKLAESFGLQPELRYQAWVQDGQPQAGIYALLHYEQREYDSALEVNHPIDSAFEALAHQIIPDTAVHFAYRLKHGRLEAIDS